MAEQPVLKTGDPQGFGGSSPSPSAISVAKKIHRYMQELRYGLTTQIDAEEIGWIALMLEKYKRSR